MSDVQLGVGLGVSTLVGGTGVFGGASLLGVSVGTGVVVGVRVSVITRRVADGDGVGVAEFVAVAVALGVMVAVAVFVADITMGVAAGAFVAVLTGSPAGTLLVAVLVAVGVGVATRPGATTTNAVAQTPSKASRPAAAPTVLRLFVRCARINSAAGRWLVPVGSACDWVCARRSAACISLALANRFVMGTSMARRITRSTSGEIVGLISRSEWNAPGLDTRRVTVGGGSPVIKWYIVAPSE